MPSLSRFYSTAVRTVVFVGKVSEGGARSSGRSTSAQKGPFSGIPRNSVIRTCPPPTPRQIPPWLLVISCDTTFPGCPVCQEIEDNFLPTASGEGLQCGVENVTSTFEVQSVGQQGDLAVNIVGMSRSLSGVFVAVKLIVVIVLIMIKYKFSLP